jgi:hypothetical protein
MRLARVIFFPHGLRKKTPSGSPTPTLVPSTKKEELGCGGWGKGKYGKLITTDEQGKRSTPERRNEGETKERGKMKTSAGNNEMMNLRRVRSGARQWWKICC